MSQENVEMVHEAINAFNRRDLAALADFCTDDFEFVSVLSAVDAGGSTYRGPDAWSEYFARMRDAWAEWWVDGFQVFDAGDDGLAAVVRIAGKGRHSGATADRAVGMTYRLRGRSPRVPVPFGLPRLRQRAEHRECWRPRWRHTTT